MQEFEVDYTKKYAQLILNFFWVVYNKTAFHTSALKHEGWWLEDTQNIKGQKDFQSRWLTDDFLSSCLSLSFLAIIAASCMRLFYSNLVICLCFGIFSFHHTDYFQTWYPNREILCKSYSSIDLSKFRFTYLCSKPEIILKHTIHRIKKNNYVSALKQ